MMILGFLIAFIGLTTVFIVDETEQVVILQFGKPVRTITCLLYTSPSPRD